MKNIAIVLSFVCLTAYGNDLKTNCDLSSFQHVTKIDGIINTLANKNNAQGIETFLDQSIQNIDPEMWLICVTSKKRTSVNGCES